MFSPLRATRLIPASLIAALVLVPYTVVSLPFQAGLIVQLAVLLLIMARAFWNGREKGERGRRSWGEGELGRGRHADATAVHVPKAVATGLGLYTAAALWGVGVGLFSGNPVRYVASQTIALLLLPAGALAFLRTRGHGAESVGRGLAIAALVACLIHGVVVAIPPLRATLAGGRLRFVFRNDADAMGAVVLLFVVLAARWAARKTLGNGLAAGAAAILLIGSQARGAWISGVVGIGVVIGISFKSSECLVRRLVIVALGVALIALTGWGLTSWAASQAKLVYTCDTTSQNGCANIPRAARALVRNDSLHLVPHPQRGAGVVLARNLPVTAPAIELDVKAKVPRGQAGFTWLRALDKNGREIDKQLLSLSGTGCWVRYFRVFILPTPTKTIHLGIWAGRGVHATLLSSVEVKAYPSIPVAWLRQITHRVTRPLRSLTGGPEDPNLAYRERELKAIWTQWSRASAGRILTGQGLGATFPFVNSAWDSQGRRTRLKRASYIHDFYVMLAFKLGLVGVLALVGLLIIVVWTYRRAIRCHAAHRWLLVGTSAAWTAYLVWSITSPEIYDFRMAPLWGALVAACVRAEKEL